MKFDVGHEFYMQAEALDLNRIVVKLSKEFFVELNQEEALNFIGKKERVMNGQIEKLSEKMAEVKAHMVFVNEAIRELLNISEDRTPKPSRQMLWATAGALKIGKVALQIISLSNQLIFS